MKLYEEQESLSLDTCIRDLEVKGIWFESYSAKMASGIMSHSVSSSKNYFLQFPNRDVKIYPIFLAPDNRMIVNDRKTIIPGNTKYS